MDNLFEVYQAIKERMGGFTVVLLPLEKRFVAFGREAAHILESSIDCTSGRHNGILWVYVHETRWGKLNELLISYGVENSEDISVVRLY